MLKPTYRFNPESLRFEKITISIKGLIVKAFTFFTASIFVAIGYYLLFARFFESPRERVLSRENRELQLQYEVMQRKLSQIELVLNDLQDRDDNLYRVIFESEPIPSTIRKAGTGGMNRIDNFTTLSNEKLVVETATKINTLQKQLYIQSKSYDELIQLSNNKSAMIAAIPSIQPVANKDLKRAAGGYGMRIDPIYKVPRMHEGMDFSVPVGTEVYATGDGVVVDRGRDGEYGNAIVIDHGFGYTTRYAHLSAFNVQKGEKVKRGEVIGKAGNTGKSTGPHVHYEVRKGGRALNPVNLYFNDLTADEYAQLVNISDNAGQAFD